MSGKEQNNNNSHLEDVLKNTESLLNEIKETNKLINNANDIVVNKGNEIKETINKSNKLYRNIFVGLLIALIAGYILAKYNFNNQISLDKQKYERDIKNNQDTSIYILCNELSNNLEWSNGLTTMIKNEFNLIENKSTKESTTYLAQPFIPLQLGAWDLIKINKPSKYLKNNIINEINDYNYRLIIINKIIDTRELFKIHDNNMSNFRSGLENYNYILNKQLKDLIIQINNLNQSLSNECKRVNF